MMRPRILVTSGKTEGLRCLAEVRAGVRTGRGATLWRQLLAKVEHEAAQGPWTPTTPLPGREEKDVRLANREYTLVGLTANRILDAAMAGLLTGDRRYAEAAWRQIRALFDPGQWPDLDDIAHLQSGFHCSLRRGQLAGALALAYDWLHGLLTDHDRRWLIDRFDERFTAALKAALDAPDPWVDSGSNFIPAIFGAFGIAGMCLAEDYAQAEWLTATADEKMDRYVANLFGRQGEFNESVQYAGSVSSLVGYFLARRYARGGRDDALPRLRLADFCRWYMHMTLPPGRVAGFGDPAPDSPPVVDHFAALGAALREPIFQWFYLQYADGMLAAHRKRCLELLYYDPTLAPQSPEGRLPLGRAYHDEGRLISSRSSWDGRAATSVVYAKAGREDNHGHADWGQVCVDGFSERLIVDLGSTPGYPRWQDKGRFYNYQQLGHNVFVFGDNETGGVPLSAPGRQGRRYLQGTIPFAEFDDARGGAWTMDLTEVYDAVARRVARTVVHLLPRVVVVLDEAELKAPQAIRMRWHTIVPAELRDGGGFTVRAPQATLAACVQRLDGQVTRALGRHEYRPPFDKDRLGQPYPQRHEPYVECSAAGDRCRLLSLFCVLGPQDPPAAWGTDAEGWGIQTPEGAVRVSLAPSGLAVRRAADGGHEFLVFCQP